MELYDLIQEFEISLYFSTVQCIIEIFNRDYWIIYCLSYDCEMLYVLDLYCSQIICSAPCVSDCV